MIAASVKPASWFQSHAGRRFYRHFAALLALKFVLLLILYFVFVAPQPRVPTSADSVFSAVVSGGPAQASHTP